MFALFGNIEAVVARVKRGFRGGFPPSGPGYELFDTSVFLLVLGFLGYVLTDPTSVTDQALTAPFTVIMNVTGITDPQHVWGYGLSIVAVVGTVCAYGNQKWLDFGYSLVGKTCLYASLTFLFGMIAYGTSVRALITVVLYAWLASRLKRTRHLWPREVSWK